MTTVLVRNFPERYMLDSYDEPLYFDDIRDAPRCVSEIVGHYEDESTEAIISARDDYLEQHEVDDDTWYILHEFIEDLCR